MLQYAIDASFANRRERSLKDKSLIDILSSPRSLLYLTAFVTKYINGVLQ
jgi:hypothetical protein